MALSIAWTGCRMTPLIAMKLELHARLIPIVVGSVTRLTEPVVMLVRSFNSEYLNCEQS